MFGFGKKVLAGAVQAGKAEVGANKDILEALAGGAAIAATADGIPGDTERSKALALINSHKKVKGVFSTQQVEETFSFMLKQAMDGQGRQQIIREFEDLKKLDGSQELRDDVYLIARDVAKSEGGIDEKEQKRLDVLAKLLDVDPARFAFEFD